MSIDFHLEEADFCSIKFATSDCSVCAHQADCTDSSPPRRTLTIRPRDQYLALQAARARQATEAFKEEYATRSGIEGTLSQGIRAFEVAHQNAFQKASK